LIEFDCRYGTLQEKKIDGRGKRIEDGQPFFAINRQSTPQQIGDV